LFLIELDRPASVAPNKTGISAVIEKLSKYPQVPSNISVTALIKLAFYAFIFI